MVLLATKDHQVASGLDERALLVLAVNSIIVIYVSWLVISYMSVSY